MDKLIIVFGTRPELIKLAPVIDEFQTQGLRESIFVVNTCQHKDLLFKDLSYFDIDPDCNFSLRRNSNSLSELDGLLMTEFNNLNQYFLENNISPKAIIAQGDTATTYTSALYSFYEKIPFFHIEAGLRTNDFNNPFPEEFYRKTISTIAALNFVPTVTAQQNLILEGIPGEKIVLTGNTVIDNLRIRIKDRNPLWCSNKSGIVLITIHRRENRSDRFDLIYRKINQLCRTNPERQFIWITHPGVNYNYLNGGRPENLEIIPPVSYAEMIEIYHKTALIITDSGGIQEEAGYLGIPSLVFRKITERVEGINSGVSNYLNGQAVEVDSLVNNATTSFNTLYGDGFASRHIVGHLVKYLPSPEMQEVETLTKITPVI